MDHFGVASEAGSSKPRCLWAEIWAGSSWYFSHALRTDVDGRRFPRIGDERCVRGGIDAREVLREYAVKLARRGPGASGLRLEPADLSVPSPHSLNWCRFASSGLELLL